MINSKAFSSNGRIPPPNNTKTLRDEIAIVAMAGCIARPDFKGQTYMVIATNAYCLADAMLKARGEGQ